MKWEYKVINNPSFSSVLGDTNAEKEQEWLNSLGEEGWEFIKMVSTIGTKDLYYFKRIKQ